VTDDADALFATLVRRFEADPAVTPPSTTGKAGKFGSDALKVDGKIFAMLTKGELVLKLPRKRVDELIASGTGTRFDPGRGRVMKEWVTVAPGESAKWPELADEALSFVARR
jgi:hypothetical protein